MSTRHPLTPTERTKILNLRKNGLALNKIAQEMHRGKKTIAKILSSSNITPKPGKSGDYKVLKVTPKKESKTFIRVDYNKPEKSGQKNSDDEEEHNKVPIEHRAVIKFLTKDGNNSREIHSSMKKVYKEAAPSLPAVTYWATQFRKGRETILNEAKSRAEAKKPTSKKVKVKKPRTNAWIWVERKNKSEPTMSKSAGTLKLAKSANGISKTKVKRSLTDKVKKSVSSSKVKMEHIKETKKNLITFKFPILSKLSQAIK